MKETAEILINMLYPRRCPVCHQITVPLGADICMGCRMKIHIIKEPKCKKCGKELMWEEREYCPDCEVYHHFFNRGVAAYPYDEIMKKSIYQMKFHNKREYARFYGKAMAEAFRPFAQRWNPLAIVPVPMYKRKQRLRGFNQAELLADEIGKIYQIPVYPRLVKRIKATMPQKGLNRKSRKQNLKEAFYIKESAQLPECILLVDDIYTTGSTLDAIAKVLKDHGVREIYFIVLCIGKPI